MEKRFAFSFQVQRNLGRQVVIDPTRWPVLEDRGGFMEVATEGEMIDMEQWRERIVPKIFGAKMFWGMCWTNIMLIWPQYKLESGDLCKEALWLNRKIFIQFDVCNLHMIYIDMYIYIYMYMYTFSYSGFVLQMFLYYFKIIKTKGRSSSIYWARVREDSAGHCFFSWWFSSIWHLTYHTTPYMFILHTDRLMSIFFLGWPSY